METYKKLFCLATIVLLLGMAGDVSAVVVWDGSSSNDWDTAANWANSAVPTSADDLRIADDKTPYPVIDSGTTAYASGFYVGYNSNTLTIYGTLTTYSGAVKIGNNASETGTLYIKSGASVTIGNSNTNIGYYGTATLDMDGGTLNVNTLRVGYKSGSTGHVQLDGGTINASGISLGASGTGTMDIEAGTLIIDGDVESTIDGYVTAGDLTAYGGTGTVNVDYNVTNAGKTTVTGTAAGGPDQVTGASPSDGAISQAITVDISWSAATGADDYDVYFGTDATPDATELKGNQAGLSYEPGTLSNATTYYWRIDSNNVAGTTAGNVWSFTTIAEPPAQVTGASPADGAVNQSITADISWSAASGATNYDVYFGTDSTPDSSELKGNQAGLSYEPGSLTNDTTYYWRIDSNNVAGTTAGNVWSFTTVVAAPAQVTGASPADAATEQAITVDISWSAATGASNYDVYFGTDATPDETELKGNQAGLSYEPGSLSNGTTYYWRIDSNNIGGTTTGNVWSFTTIVTAPAQVTGASPANAATNVSITTDLSWSAASGADNYDVYFGQTSPGTLQGNQVATTYDTGTMSNNTTYYWRIDSNNVAGTTTGNVWSFTTVIAPPAQVTGASPADAATNVSVNTDISWSAASGATNYDVYFGQTSPGTLQGNQVGLTYDTGTMSNDTTYYWRIDSNNIGGTTTGNVWSFTTIIAAPDQVTGASPADGAIDQDLNVDLSWSAAARASNYDVYFGQTSPGTLQGNQAGVTYEPGSLSINTTYYWRIDSNNVAGMTTGNVWSFTTMAVPAQVTGASPADAATNQSITQDISWSAASGATNYDVYFGETSPGTSQGNQAAISFDTGSMDNATTYYWRIDSNNAAGMTTGNVWSFTTIVAAPAQVTGASPADAATNQSITQDISWSAATGADNYDVYFGQTSPGTLQGNQVTTSFDTGSMSNATTYYWRIDSNNVGGTTTGNVWSFTTIVAASAQVTGASPSDGATSQAVTVNISWSAASGASNYDVYFGTDSSPDSSELKGNQAGVSYEPGSLTNDTTYYWRIDSNNVAGITTGNVWSFTTESEGSAEITLDAISSSSSGSASSTLAWSHTVGSGTNRLLVVAFGGQDASEGDLPVTGVTYGSASLTKVTSQIYGSGTRYVGSELWYLQNPDSGTDTITITCTDSVERRTGGAVSLEGVAQQAAEATATNTAGENGPGITISTNITTQTDGAWVIDVVTTQRSNDGSSTWSTTTGGMTERWDHLQGNRHQSAGSTKPVATAGQTTMSWSHDYSGSNSQRVAHAVAAFAPASGGQLPAAASNPSPANAATDVSTTMDLSWTADANADNHDVYFGTTTPGTLQGNQAAVTFDTGSMDIATIYYWRIDSNNSNGMTTGTIWSFTTIVAAPAQVSGPDPNNGDTLVNRNADLNWDAAAGADNYDVYFGTDSTPDSGELKGNQSATSYDTGTMDINTTYYWRIDSNNVAGMTTGAVWSFTTMPTPGVATSPSPTNGATDVNVTSDLSWTAGTNAVSYNVYLGTDSTPDSSELQGNYAATSYDPGVMDTNTTYYWRLDSLNDAGTTTGSVWSFTTSQQDVTPDVNAPVGWWKLNENSGTSAADSSSNNNDGTLVNLDAADWVDGFAGNGLQINGTTGEALELPTDALDAGRGTVALWAYMDQVVVKQFFFGHATQPWSNRIQLYCHSDGALDLGLGDNSTRATDIKTLSAETWYHLAVTWDGTNYAVYVDGTEEASGSYTGLSTLETYADAGNNGNSAERDEALDGVIDEVRFYDYALDANAMAIIADPNYYVSPASNPDPNNGATNVSVSIDLSWTAGVDANSHDVYLGTNYSAVADANSSSAEFMGNVGATSYNPPNDLDYSTTYYWAIDELDVNDTVIAYGDIWSFTTEADPNGGGSAPGAATNPSPTDGAANVSVTSDLSWTGDVNATGHDVYFGTDSTPDSSEFQGNQVATTFDTGTMNNNTTYYWRIDEKNAVGATTGSVWSFTTIVAGPGQASNPAPADATYDVSITADLSWSAATGADNYNVYFGTDSTPDSGELKGNQTATTYDPGTLSNNTTYYWRIDPNNASGITAGVVWNFTTIPAAPSAASNPVPADGAVSVSATADLSWTGDTTAANFDVYFGTDSTPDSGELQGNQAVSNFDPGSLNYTTTYYWRIDSNNAAGTTTGSVWSFTTMTGGSSGQWSNQDIGDVGAAGSLDITSGTFTIDASGADIWGTADEFHFAYQTLSGDGYIQAHVVSVENTHDWAKAGVMIRETLNANSAFAFMLMRSVTGSSYHYRTSTGAEAAHTENTSPSTPYWVKVVRSGSTLSGYISSDGSSWTQVGGDQTISMNTDVYFGLAVTSHDDSTLCTAIFDNVETSLPVPPSGYASNPTPADSQTDVAISADLSWSAGAWAADVNGHDVYFGTSSSDVNAGTGGTSMGLVSDTSFEPGVLDINTTYYWAIDEVNDSNGSSPWTGDVWNFTTISPTLKATNPSPSDETVNVDPNANLSWTAGYFAASSNGHNVYFGTDSTPDAGEFQGAQTATTFEPGSLDSNTTYYWAIDEVNDGNTWSGDTWSFTTSSGVVVGLGDLQVPATRIPTWNPGVEGGVPDTSGWNVYCDVTDSPYNAVADDGQDDRVAIQSAINAANAAGGNQVVYVPAGVFRGFGDGSSLRLRMKSNVLLRGAGRDLTTITGAGGGGSDAQSGVFMGGADPDAAVDITSSSLPRGTTTITVADASGFSVGDFCMMLQDNDTSYLHAPSNVLSKKMMRYIFKISAKNGNTLTMDRPLRHHFGTSFNPRLEKMNPIVNSGIEDMKLMCDELTHSEWMDHGKNTGPLGFYCAVNCWTKNVYLYNGHRRHIQTKWSARCTIIDCKFFEMMWGIYGSYVTSGKDLQYNNHSLMLANGTVDCLVTNNAFIDNYVDVIIYSGACGNVASYNYCIGPRGVHGIFFHGTYPHENLFEGNDSDSSITIDNWWGEQGPRNSMFRNRLVDTGYFKNEENTGSSHPSRFIGDYLNIIGNIAWSYHTEPRCQYDSGGCYDYDVKTTNMWLERNIYRDTRGAGYGLILKTPEPTTTDLNNYGGDKAPAGWSTFNMPASLYLTQKPDWWPSGKPWPCIGSDVDDFTGTLTKLPAQDRYEAEQ